MITIGSARHDEYGGIGNSKTIAGDQTGHEVEMQPFYVHSKGWYIFRAKNSDHAERLASKMKDACNNDHIGYNQLRRNNIMKTGINTNNDTECDCSSLVRCCIFEATGVDVGNITTATLPTVLNKSGLFKPQMTYKAGVTLYNGDIICTQTKGHVCIVVSGNSRQIVNKSKTVDELAKEVIQGKWGSGADRKLNLTSAGYDYAAVQKRVNEILKGK